MNSHAIYQNMEALCRWGGRIPGTNGYERAQDYIIKRMSELGYEPHIETYRLELTETIKCTVGVRQSGEWVPLNAVPYVGGPPFWGNTCRLSSEYFITQNVNACQNRFLAINLTDDPEYHWKMVEGKRAGAAGFLLYDNQNKELTTPCAFRPVDFFALACLEGQVPAVRVAGFNPETYGPQNEIVIDLELQPKEVEAKNLLFTLPKAEGKRIILDAHYDSDWALVKNPGAFDNAAAVAVLLAMAEKLQSDRTLWPGGVTFSFSGAEEFNAIAGLMQVVPPNLFGTEYRHLLPWLAQCIFEKNPRILNSITQANVFKSWCERAVFREAEVTIELDGVGSDGKLWISTSDKKLLSVIPARQEKRFELQHLPNGSGSDLSWLHHLTGVKNVFLGCEDPLGIVHTLNDLPGSINLKGLELVDSVLTELVPLLWNATKSSEIGHD